MSSLLQLIEHGQSYWLDNLTRGMIVNGELRKRAKKEGLRGITSNPAIFNKAISKSHDYDEQIKQLVAQKTPVGQIYERLVVKDVQDACDIMHSVYKDSDGLDGFVSLEVSPYLAHDTQGTIEEARRLAKAVNRPNLFIKIPGTPAGVPAIEQMLYEGVNINITLLFSIESYEAVAAAYIKALQRRLEEGKSIEKIASVASFFLSRIDVLVDQLLGHRIRPEVRGGGGKGPRAEELLGTVAIANAKLAYQSFKKLFRGKRWQTLEEKGARVQRLLWASTSTKDPLYDDVRYVEPLIGPHTVNTLPDETIEAFADHGVVEKGTIEQGVSEARKVMAELASVGVDLDQVTVQLQSEGIQKFIDPFDQLISTLTRKRAEILGKKLNGQQVAVDGAMSSLLQTALKSLDDRQFSKRLFARDATLWKSDPFRPESIRNRLGWLDSLEDFLGKLDEIERFARDVKKGKFEHVVLLGMGGSSLCPEVCRETFGSARGWPALIVLDNTAPDAVRAVESQIQPRNTLFIVASKSGTTTETSSFYSYFYDRLDSKNKGAHFVAITDPGSSLAKEASRKGFRACFLNPEDIGGRYSALSYFGLVPMALLGMDVRALLDRALQFKATYGKEVPASVNPGIELGVLLALLHFRGRDKITFFLSEPISAFGVWVEQLLAESTGKQGVGLVPIVDESAGKPGVYASDRVFVYMRLRGADNQALDRKVEALEKEGHPVVRIDLDEKIGLGEEFYRWELATAVAASTMKVNPFDEPNVSESKENTRQLISEWKKTGELVNGFLLIRDGELAVYGGGSGAGKKNKKDRPADLLSSFVGAARPPDYIALLPYFQATPARERALQSLRKKLRDRLNVATMLGYGPRYLHSTGQLYKGGSGNGIFVILTADPAGELPIPGESYDFGILQEAQALGDFAALQKKGRRVLRVHINGQIEKGLGKLAKFL